MVRKCQIQDKFRRELNSEHVPEIKYCPVNSRTDGHFISVMTRVAEVGGQNIGQGKVLTLKEGGLDIEVLLTTQQILLR